LLSSLTAFAWPPAFSGAAGYLFMVASSWDREAIVAIMPERAKVPAGGEGSLCSEEKRYPDACLS
jgi:hypothetical protein